MSAMENPLSRAGQHLVGAVRRASAHDLSPLFAGSKAEMEERWACSAVHTKNGEWLVVGIENHVQDGDSPRVRLHGGGVFGH